MRRLLELPLLAGLVLIYTCGAVIAQAHAVKSVKAPCPSEGRYYILTKATLISPETVLVFGASNLPPGALLVVYISNYVGEGSTNLNREIRVVVGKDGLFTAEIHPKEGLTFRANMICSVVFEPNYPLQPQSVLKVVGIRGRRLGTYATNPQAQDYPSQTDLVDLTVVTP